MNRRQRDRLHRATAARSPQAAANPALPTALQAAPNPGGPAGDRTATGAADLAAPGDRPASPRRRRGRSHDAATAAPGAPPAGHGEPATAEPAAAPAPDAMDEREAALEADYRGLLAMRPAGGWSAIERRQVRALAERMSELAAINRQIEDDGLMVPGRGGKLVAHPLISVRKATELAIKRARTDLGLNISVGESRRQGRAQAAAGDEYGRRPDGSWSPLLAYALDRGEFLARPENHDPAPERALHERLYQAGEIEIGGTPRHGGVLWRDQIRAGMNVAPRET